MYPPVAGGVGGADHVTVTGADTPPSLAIGVSSAPGGQEAGKTVQASKAAT